MRALAERFERAPSHVNAAADRFASPLGDRCWTVCRFVGHLDTSVRPAVRGPARYGWPIRESGGWSKDAPVSFFTHEEAQRLADADNARAHAGSISYDAPVHVTAIRWTVSLYSHFDGSKIEGETGDYAEAFRAFTAACGVAARENTPTVAYLVASLDGKADPPVAGHLPVNAARILPAPSDPEARR